MGIPGVLSFVQERRRLSAAIAFVAFMAAVIVVFAAAARGGTTALANPTSANDWMPPLRLFVLLMLLLVGLWLLGMPAHWAQLVAVLVLGLTISWALQPYEQDDHNEIAAAMHDKGVLYAQIGDVFGFVALLACAAGMVAAVAILIAPGRAPSALGTIAANMREALGAGVALPVVASAFVLAVFAGDAWEAMGAAPGANIAGLSLAALMSAVWLLNRNTAQPWWLVTVVILLLFSVLVFVFLLTTSLLVQPETSLGWIGEPLPEGVATMESARIKLAVMFSAIAVVAAVNSEKPEIQGAG